MIRSFNITAARWRIAGESAAFKPLHGFRDGSVMVDSAAAVGERARLLINFESRTEDMLLQQIASMGKRVELEVEIEGPEGAFTYRAPEFRPRRSSETTGGLIEFTIPEPPELLATP